MRSAAPRSPRGRGRPNLPLGDYTASPASSCRWGLVFYFNGFYGRRAARTSTEMSRLFRALVRWGAGGGTWSPSLQLRQPAAARPLPAPERDRRVTPLGLVRGLVLESTVRRRVRPRRAGRGEGRGRNVEAHADWVLELVGVVSDGTWTRRISGSPPPTACWAPTTTSALSARRAPRHRRGANRPVGPAAPTISRRWTRSSSASEQGIATRLVVVPAAVAVGAHLRRPRRSPAPHVRTAPHDELVLFVRRAVELVLALLLLAILSPMLAVIAIAIKFGLRGSGSIPPEARRAQRPAVHHAEVPLDERRRRRRSRPTRARQRDGRPRLQDDRRSAGHAARPLPAPHQPRRAAAALERPPRRHEPRWPAPVPSSRTSTDAPIAAACVNPGLTCLWQVSGRNELSFPDWMRLDLQYIDNWSL